MRRPREGFAEAAEGRGSARQRCASRKRAEFRARSRKRLGGTRAEFVVWMSYAQLRINPRGELAAISTHDQILAADGQTYLGCRFPAAPEYRMVIQEDALKVGAVLREKGVIGRSAVDFVTFRNPDGAWGRSAIEINLRMSGTTHPLMLMKLVNDGKYDAKTGVFRTRRGEERCYVASDSLMRPEYKGLAVEDLLDIAAVHGLHYRPWTDSGVIFQLTGALSQFGKVGITCIGATQVEAQQVVRRDPGRARPRSGAARGAPLDARSHRHLIAALS